MTNLVRTLALAGVLASSAVAVAMAPYSDEARTETAGAQELGSITVDGLLVYSMNYCTMVQSTNCEVSLSTGGPVPPPSAPGSPYSSDEATDTGNYPDPAPGEPGQPTGRDGSSVSGGGEPTHPPTNSDTASGTSSLSVSETGQGPTLTSGDSGSTTESAASGTSTAGGAIVGVSQAGVIGIVGMAAALLV